MFKTARIIAAIMLVLALGGWPYVYYEILRFVVCGVAGYGAYLIYERSIGWASGFGIMVILFNPIVPIHMNRGDWAVVDLLAAGVFLYSIKAIKGIEPKKLDCSE